MVWDPVVDLLSARASRSPSSTCPDSAGARSCRTESSPAPPTSPRRSGANAGSWGSSAPTSPATASAAGSRWKWAAKARLRRSPPSPPPVSGGVRSGPAARTRSWSPATCAPRSPSALRLRHPREAMLRTFAAHPERIPAETGRRLVLGWIDASGYTGANRAMRTHLFDPAGYPEDVPVTIAWGELDRLVGPPKPDRRPAGARFLAPARRRPHPDLGRPGAGRPHAARGQCQSGRVQRASP